jgi:hypothetical protein
MKAMAVVARQKFVALASVVEHWQEPNE